MLCYNILMTKKTLYNRHSLARKFGVKPHTIDAWRRAGKLKPTRITERAVYYTEEAVQEMIQNSTEEN
ncbi:MAG: MerR family transcriptional regulator [Phaeodactylibacter sp.]|nr:MerR family transcriptional regulator [Phaeodactylibacter sp.]